MDLNFSKSLKGRLSAYFALAIVVSLLVSGLVSAGLVQRYLRHRTVSDLTTQAVALSSQIESEGLPVRRYIADLELMYQTRTLIIPYAEQALGRLPRLRGAIDEVEPTPPQGHGFIDWQRLETGETQVTETRLPESDTDVIVVAHGFRVDGDLAGAVVLAKPQNSLQSWLPLAGWFLVAAAVSLVISLILAFLLARRLARPLHEITESAAAVASGDYSHELHVKREDEIGRLADAFRHMTGEVKRSQEQQRQFLINVSHELKTPLTAIAGHVQALRDGVAGRPAEVASSMEVISREAGRLGRLIEDLLDTAKLDAGRFGIRRESVDSAALVRSVAEGFVHEFRERRVILEYDLTEVPHISTDPDRVRQIVANLMQNALWHTGPGGVVSLGLRSSDGVIEISVSDTGAGIDPDDLLHIFERFYRSGDGRRPGLGLGLPISRELARGLGGDISAKSELGKGSLFVLSLPHV